MQLCDINTVRELMEKYGLTLKKSYGQNFLINPEVPRRIAESSRSFADCDKPAGVIEIGPGVGALTQYLCQEYDKVLAIELDRGLIPLLHEALGEYDNYKVLEADFMKTDLASLIDEHFRDITDNGGTVSPGHNENIRVIRAGPKNTAFVGGCHDTTRSCPENSIKTR
jgi:16S rRNA (adenine1518-N6/adenine1519-N6)-dimethyltransferase